MPYTRLSNLHRHDKDTGIHPKSIQSMWDLIINNTGVHVHSSAEEMKPYFTQDCFYLGSGICVVIVDKSRFA